MVAAIFEPDYWKKRDRLSKNREKFDFFSQMADSFTFTRISLARCHENLGFPLRGREEIHFSHSYLLRNDFVSNPHEFRIKSNAECPKRWSKTEKNISDYWEINYWTTILRVTSNSCKIFHRWTYKSSCQKLHSWLANLLIPLNVVIEKTNENITPKLTIVNNRRRILLRFFTYSQLKCFLLPNCDQLFPPTVAAKSSWRIRQKIHFSNRTISIFYIKRQFILMRVSSARNNPSAVQNILPKNISKWDNFWWQFTK